MNKPLSTILACLSAAVSLSAVAAEGAGNTSATDDRRYVWAGNLTLRDAPDVKAEALAHLPLGAAVQLLPTSQPLIHREESLPGLKLDREVEGKPLKICGDWRRVRVGAAQGWVFDGYLSRYPYPKATRDSDKVAMEFAVAKTLFGAKSRQQWMTGDAINTPPFNAMPQRLKDEADPKNHAEISWERVYFAAGGQGELAIDTHMGGEGWTVVLDKLPMTYEETLLWAKRWGWTGGYGVALDDGRAKLRFDFNETQTDMDYTIACEAQTCSIQYSFATE